MNNLLVTTIFENGFQEIYLPAVDNKSHPIEIRPSISGLTEDIVLPLEVWGGVWTLENSTQYSITIDEVPTLKTELEPGKLLNCTVKGTDIVFSLTVTLANVGNTSFDKYFLNLKNTTAVTIGSKPTGNLITYANRFCSPTHAEITLEGDTVFIDDKNSVNGTFVNGRLLTSKQQLFYGDVIYIVGLKIVYLDNVLAVNNPKGECTVSEQQLKKIKIEPTEFSDTVEEVSSDDQYFLRTPRKVELIDRETFSIERAPTKSTHKQQPLFMTLGPSFTMVIPMLAGTMLNGGSSNIASALVMSLGAAVIGGGWAVLNIKYNREEAANTESFRINSYNQYLEKMSAQISHKMDYNKAVLYTMLPDARQAVSFAMTESPRLWEKSSVHADFLHVTLGNCNIPSFNEVKIAKEQGIVAYDPLNDSLENIKARTFSMDNVPSEISLDSNMMIGVVSKNRANALNIVRVITSQLTALHTYTELRTAFIYPMNEFDMWDHARYLPHTWAPQGSVRMIANDKNSVGDVLFFLSTVVRDRLEKYKGKKVEEKILPHYVIVIGDISLIENEPMAKYLLSPTEELGITVILPVSSTDKLPAACSAIIRDDEDYNGFYSTNGSFDERTNLAFTQLPVHDMNAYTRKLSGFKVRELGTSSAIPEILTFLDMYKTSNVDDLEVMKKWLENRTYESMKAMIGYKSGGMPLYLDIHEKYHGPHGLVAGTTGSGKSETLQSYILSLAVNYHPHEVAFILIDYKGGGMAQSFLGLPHLAGVITNLGGNATDRALLSINAEIKHRQKVFNDYKVKHIDAYIELYRSGVASEPMPHLLIIADEFAELKKEQPEFVRALVSAARVGRSLGVNLILATQKPSGVVDDEIWSNTRFRLCLRVADKQDSTEMLKRPDAAFITGTGRGYFQVGSDEIFDEFQSGWSGAEYTPNVAFTDDKNSKVELLNIVGKNAVPKKKSKKKSDNIAKLTQLDAIVKHLGCVASENDIASLRQIWLEPLASSVYLEQLEVPQKQDEFSLLLPVGFADSPKTQSQFTVCVDFLRDGHLLVCGSGGSGKTTLLQTLIYSAVTKYTAEEVNIYIADFSSRTMTVFADLPQVGGVMFEGEDDKIEQVFDLLKNTLSERKNKFSQMGIGSYRDYITQSKDCPALLFFIDNYVAFADSYDRYEDTLIQLTREAASYGIFIVLAINNTGDIRGRMRQNFTNGIALQMADKFEYESVLGIRSDIMPDSRTAGRGLIKAPMPLEFQVALCVKEDPGASPAQTLRRKFAELKGDKGVKKLGAKVEGIICDEFVKSDAVKALDADTVAIGVEADSHELFTADLDKIFCYTVSGFADTGKKQLMKSIAMQVKNKGAKLYLFDTAGSELEQLGIFDGVCHSDEELFALMENMLVGEFTRRNAIVNDARDSAKEVKLAMQKEQRIALFIGDMNMFMQAVYSSRVQMNEFLEIALQKGKEHKINLFAAMLPDDYFDNARFDLMRTWSSHNTGTHLGGMFDQQGALSFEMSASDSARQLPAGSGYTSNQGEEDKLVKIVTPLAAATDDII